MQRLVITTVDETILQQFTFVSICHDLISSG